MEESDEFDDFLFDSIKRYNTLQMFNLECEPHHILRLDETTVCIASHSSKGNISELLRLQLPKKLFLSPEEEGRSKENDFKVLSGTYTKSLVQSIGKCENKILTSELNIKGINIYDIFSRTIGSNICQDSCSFITWTNPNFTTVKSTNFLICSKSNQDSILLVDLKMGELVKEFKLNVIDSRNEQTHSKDSHDIRCEALNNNMIVVLNTFSGDLLLHDLRTDNDSFLKLLGHNEKLTHSIRWTLSKHDSSNSDTNYLGILSNSNAFCIYDCRKLNKLFERAGNGFAISNGVMPKMKFPENQDKFSVSGLDSNVNVFEITDKTFKHLFTHNGHSPGNVSKWLVTDHIWLPVDHKELIVSICNNKTLNCWEYNV